MAEVGDFDSWEAFERFGLYVRAIDLLLLMRSTCRELNDELSAAFCDQQMGRLLVAIERPENGLALIESAHAVIGERCRDEDVLRNEVLLCAALSEVGRKREALERLREARVQFNALRDLEGASGCLVRLGAVLSDVGAVEEAMDVLMRGLHMSEALGDRLGVARCLEVFGVAERRAGEYEDALQSHDTARATFGGLGWMRLLADCHANIAAVFTEMGVEDHAAKHAEAARKMLGAIRDVDFDFDEVFGPDGVPI